MQPLVENYGDCATKGNCCVYPAVFTNALLPPQPYASVLETPPDILAVAVNAALNVCLEKSRWQVPNPNTSSRAWGGVGVIFALLKMTIILRNKGYTPELTLVHSRASSMMS